MMKEDLSVHDKNLITFMEKLAKNDDFYNTFTNFICKDPLIPELKNFLAKEGLAPEVISYILEKKHNAFRTHLQKIGSTLPMIIIFICLQAKK